MYDDLRDRCKNEDWFRSQIESPQNEKYTKDLGQKGINLFGKNKPLKESGFHFKKTIEQLMNIAILILKISQSHEDFI